MWGLEWNWVNYCLHHGELERILNPPIVKQPKIKGVDFLRNCLGYPPPSLSLFLPLPILFFSVFVSLSIVKLFIFHFLSLFPLRLPSIFFLIARELVVCLKMLLDTLSLRYWEQDAQRPLLTGWVNLNYLNLLLQRSYAKVGSGQKLQTTPNWHDACLKRIHHFTKKWYHLFSNTLKEIFGEILFFLYFGTAAILTIFLQCHSSLSPKESSHLFASLTSSTGWLQWSVQWTELIRERIKPITVARFTITTKKMD